jgi:uncharacterized protein YeaO (DUF488 family)
MSLMLLTLVLIASSSWIPARQEDFADFCRVWKAELSDNDKVTLFGWDKPTVLTVLAAINGFLDAWEMYREVNSSYNRTKKNELMTAVIHDMEMFADTSVRYNAKMSEGDKNRLGIYAPKPKSRIKPPATAPVLEPHAGTPGQVVVPYRAAGSKRMGKPPKVLGIKIHWGVLDHAPAGWQELTNVAIDTDSPFYLNFGSEDRGKQVYMYGCWVIEREVEEGPPSEIVSCYIG